jgi:tRNA (mo5U34)-methyltransferase
MTRLAAIMTDVATLRQQVSQIRWFHTIDLGHGIVTPGATRQEQVLPRLHLPERLDHRRVLDVGAWDGFYSFEAERRGAQVLATDHFCWSGPGWGTKAGFDLAHDALGSGVESLDIDPMDFTPDALRGTFDLVLVLGVLYHVKSPLELLERIRSVTSGMLILETVCSMLLARRPAAAFFPGAELNHDASNWWTPNVPATIGMLRVAGFKRVQVVHRNHLVRRCAAWVHHLTDEHRVPFRQAATMDRIVFHAWA